MMKYLLIMCTMLSFFSCSKEIKNPMEYKGKLLNIGSGGGFTGAMNGFSILENGQVFKGIDSSATLIGKLDKKLITQLFNSYITLGFDNNTLDNPGNTYKFIEMVDNGKMHKITWGGKNLEDKNLDIFYKNAMSFVNKLQKSDK